MKNFIIALLLLFSQAAWAQTQINVAFTSANGQTVNPLNHYGSTITYYIGGPMTESFNIDGTTYTINWHYAVEEAINEWRQELQGTGVTLVEATSGNEPSDIYINLVQGLIPADMNTTEFGSTTINVPHDAENPTTIFMYRNMIEHLFTIPDYRYDQPSNQFGATLVDGGAQGLLNFIVKLALKHEIGHALGFAHTGQPGMPYITVTANIRPPVMTDDLSVFIITLVALIAQDNGTPRPVTANDIAIAPAEGMALRAFILGQQPCSCTSGSGKNGVNDEIKAVKNTITVYPNPAKNEFYINFPTHTPEKVRVEIYDMSGKLITSEDGISSDAKKSISTDGLINGTYIVKVKGQGLDAVSKVIVNK